ncbi:1-propanol dehydrogenase PduQ [Propionispora hippei]|uniref:Alcohol dehydrogenase, class IV n=1 Tax=Propionispora hippei DSM 15287 TaxID=1123003 RepID=A0A1M6JFJ4_9FIRM|nr:1-propanol dehydrogenase PduQ [Propionispora hippei]SHJ45486.1 Alcohol dehydrogenase, class IV [Propionispora hippei DSM 15287]
MAANVFQVRPVLYYGVATAEVIEQCGAKKALVITDPFMKDSELLTSILQRLSAQMDYRLFADIRPDPDVSLVARGTEALLAYSPDLVIAVGGGSTIDTAKSILYCVKQALPDREAIKFIAIPTTSGTGSEVTNFSIVTVDGKKLAIVDDQLVPDIAILDAAFTESVPPVVTADTGIDVLTHALEAYFSTQASNYTDALAEKAIELVFTYLPRTVKNGKDKEAREQMHDASCLAGMAFTNASLGINHSLAHALGGSFHIPHGRANALLLPGVIGYNAASPVVARRCFRLAGLLGLSPANQADGVRRLLLAVRILIGSIGIPGSLAQMDIDREAFFRELPAMCQAALDDKCTATNPVVPSLQELAILLTQAYAGLAPDEVA